MNELNKETLLNIDGGLSINGSIINAFARALESVLGLGRSLGTAIRRINSGKLCSIN